MINNWFTGCFRAAICLCVLVLFVVVLAGCNSGTLAETAEEVRIRHTIDGRTKTQQIQDVTGWNCIRNPMQVNTLLIHSRQ